MTRRRSRRTCRGYSLRGWWSRATTPTRCSSRTAGFTGTRSSRGCWGGRRRRRRRSAGIWTCSHQSVGHQPLDLSASSPTNLAPSGPVMASVSAHPDVMDKLVSLCKRRGFIFQSSEIYGGTGSVWDYGPLGVELKRNVKDAWWRAMVHERDDIEGLDAAILMHPKVWEASGHVAGFTDPLIECSNCHRRFRADDP